MRPIVDWGSPARTASSAWLSPFFFLAATNSATKSPPARLFIGPFLFVLQVEEFLLMFDLSL